MQKFAKVQAFAFFGRLFSAKEKSCSIFDWLVFFSFQMLAKFLLLASVMLLAVNAGAIYDIHEDIIHEEWEAFKTTHNKEYIDDREEDYRRKIYIENRKKIARHNMKAASNGVSYHLKMNEYGQFGLFCVRWIVWLLIFGLFVFAQVICCPVNSSRSWTAIAAMFDLETPPFICRPTMWSFRLNLIGASMAT